MTGTTDLSIEQFRALNNLIEAEQSRAAHVVRVILHPIEGPSAFGPDVRVVLRILIEGDVTEATRVILREGRVLTQNEYTESWATAAYRREQMANPS